jgi:molybdate transport system substrate-binding protein
VKKNALSLATAALLLVGLAACGDNDDIVGQDGVSGTPTTSADPAATELTVFAAKSLTESFTELGKAYEAAHAGAKVTFSFAGSQELVAQLQQGAPADVVATADQATVDKVATELEAPAQVFASNQLAIVTEKGNPLGITGLADLAKGSTKVVLAGPTVPVGKAARKALDAARITVKPVSEEQDVKAVLSKVRLGEADAGIVYVTDVKAAAVDVAGIDLPGVSNVYPIGVLDDAAHDPAADAFVAFVLSADGQAVLQKYGFKPAA